MPRSLIIPKGPVPRWAYKAVPAILLKPLDKVFTIKHFGVNN